jgi:two-component system, NtrC family, sensor kinase
MLLKQLGWYKRIGTRISLYTSLLVVCLLSTYTFFILLNQRWQLIDEVMRSASLLSDTVKLSAREDMLHYLPDRLHQLVDTIGNQPSLEKIRIFNYVGEIIYSSDKSEMHKMLDKRAEQCYACHAAEQPLVRLNTPERARVFKAAQGYRVLGMINPIYNEPDCYNASCHVHPPDQKVLGVLDIDISLKSMDERILASEVNLLLSGIITLVTLALLVRFLINRFFNQPVRELIEGTQRVAQGDLDFQIPIRSEDEVGIFAASFNRMTDDLKRAKASLTEWGNRLEHLVEERTHDLREAQQQLIRSEKLASLGKLAAGIAHEINNPLTGVLTFTQLLMDETPPGSSQHQDLEVIFRETIRCRNIVRGLLEFSRQTAAERRSVDVRSLLEEVLKIVANQESFQGIEIIMDADRGLPRLMASPDQLKQVFFNIVVNAAEAMTSEGILKIRTEFDRPGNQVLLYFEDNGPGISQENLDKLFDPFFTTKEMGTGLGLAVSYGIIKGHGGEIVYHSQPGQGCQVVVSLPVESPA